MAVDKYGNTIIKKDLWADGGWYTAFVLVPILAGWVILFFLLIYGVYFTFRYDIEHAKAGFLFITFAFLVSLGAIPFARSVWILLTEKIIFTSERFIYQGFGSYSLPYKSIKRITLREKKGPFGRERLLAISATADTGQERFYIIPRWKTLSGGTLAQEFSKRISLSLLDRGLLAYYAASAGREWWLPIILAFAALVAIFSFLLARTSPESTSSIAVLFWLVLAILLIIFLARYIGRKKDITLEA